MKTITHALLPSPAPRSMKVLEGIRFEGMVVGDSDQPRLSSVGSVNVITATVHNEETHLTVQTMLERASSQSPIESIQDLEEVLTRDLVIDCDCLITNIRRRSRLNNDWVLCLSRNGRCWTPSFIWVGACFDNRCQVLCLG